MLFKEIVDTRTHARTHGRWTTDNGQSQKLTLSTLCQGELKTTTNYFVLETNTFLFLSAGKLSGRSQLMHFRKMLSAFSFLLFILVSQFSLGFKFNQQHLVSNWSLLLKGYAVITIFRTHGLAIQIAHKHHCVVIFFWSSGIMECTCMLFTFENGVPLMH